jgi:hypothetical protein
MHLVNCSVAPAQLLPQVLLLEVWGAACAWVDCAGSLLLPPPKMLLMPLPTTWPMEEPIATPLFYHVSFHIFAVPVGFSKTLTVTRKEKRDVRRCAGHLA